MTLRHRLLLPLLCFVSLLCTRAARAENWYVRADGGNRAQCDGKTDAAYPKHGSGKHCAFGDVRYLWDGHEYGKLHWVIAGGDTVLIDNTKQWRIGWDGTGSSQDRAVENWCWGWSGAPYGCFNPAIPAGTALHHTRMLGRNWEHCNVGNTPDKTKMTQIFGGHGVWTTLYLGEAQFVDVQCLEITRHSQCIRYGEPRVPSTCRTDIPLDDYDADGLYTDSKTHDLFLQDLWIHGHVDRGVKGAIGGVVTANRVDISTNGMAGWDFDDGNGTKSVNAVWNFTNSLIEWSGCNQEYPAVHPVPVISCYGQSNGGYGDSVGTPDTGMDVHIDHSVFRWNTQDGPDFNHVDEGSHHLTITNTLSYANNGGQFKWGPSFTDVLFVNNIAIADCLRLSQAFPGAPASYNAHLGDFCRAEDAISAGVGSQGHVVMDNNTIVSYAPTTVDFNCWVASCSTTTVLFRNNLVVGYDNPGTYGLGGKPGGPGSFYYNKPIGTVLRANNLFYGLRNVHCERSEICADPRIMLPPRLTKEADLDNFSVHLLPNSPARNAGMHLPDLKTDFDGKPRPATGPYTIGAIQ